MKSSLKFLLKSHLQPLMVTIVLTTILGQILVQFLIFLGLAVILVRQAPKLIGSSARSIHTNSIQMDMYPFFFFSNLSLHTVMRWITLRGRIGSRIRRWKRNMMKILGVFGMIAKREILFHRFLLALLYFFSILSSSARCERAFSRMGWMVANRRAAITADNADKRLALCNQLPQKRRLLELCRERKIKRTKSNEDLFK